MLSFTYMDPEKMLKGRMVESLVEELIRESGNTIYRFGYEAILQNLTQIEKSFNGGGDAGNQIRAIPDFIVIDKQGNPTFLEVKFRWNGELHEHDHERLQRIKDFWNAKIVFVNCTKKPYFQISIPPYFDKDNNFKSESLCNETAWKINQEICEKFEALVEKYLKQSLLKKS